MKRLTINYLNIDKLKVGNKYRITFDDEYVGGSFVSVLIKRFYDLDGNIVNLLFENGVLLDKLNNVEYKDLDFTF